MECYKIRKLIPDFLEGFLDSEKQREISGHLRICISCAKEKKLYEESWQLIGQLTQIEPAPGFETRFWNRLISQTEPKLIPAFDFWGLARRWSVALATAAIIIIAVSFILPNYFQTKKVDLLASKINDEEIILVENIDLLQNLDIIEQIDFLENLELIENLDNFQLDKT